MISIIHPSRGRPAQAAIAARKWIDSCGVEYEYILSLDSDDPAHYQYASAFPFGHKARVITNSNRSAIDAINNAARIATGDILIQIADDFDCPPLWGQKILDAVDDKKDWVMKTQDGIQNYIITLPIMDWTYYNRFGYIYHPDYLHMFCDTELSCVADLTARRITANIPFKHNHYSVGGIKDAISERADKTWAQGEKLFLTRYRQNFGLRDIPGRIQDQSIHNWVRSKNI